MDGYTMLSFCRLFTAGHFCLLRIHVGFCLAPEMGLCLNYNAVQAVFALLSIKNNKKSLIETIWGSLDQYVNMSNI